VIDRSDFQNCRQCDAKLFVQFAAYSLFGCLTFFNTASGGPVEDKTGLRVLNFRDQECIAMPDEAQGSLSYLEFHVLTAPESFYDCGHSPKKQVTVNVFYSSTLHARK
jgi:hypothetical protein